MSLRSSAFVASLFATILAACGEETSPEAAAAPVTATGSAPTCRPAPAPLTPAASCSVTIETPPIAPTRHVPEGTPIAYCSNPPSSGDHYPIWADFRQYDAPVAWPYLVHSLEHGAVALLYKCAPPGCPDIVEALVRIRDEAASDPLCPPGTKRILIAPSDAIPSTVAAAAWGKTYLADCVDRASLEGFVRDAYAKGPENLCAAGRAF